MYTIAILSIALIIVIIIVAVKNKQKIKESYKPPSHIPPNYTKYNTNLTEISTDPSGEPLAFNPKNNFNYTQLYYAFLVQLFQALSYQKKQYSKTLVKNYPKNTIDDAAKDKLNLLVQPMLERIKQIAPMTDFWLVGYESWRVYQENNGPLKINQIDLFLYDRVGWTEVRLLMEIAELPKNAGIGKYNCRHIADKKLKTCAAETTPDFPRYYIGYPANNQLIPLPTEVIVTEKSILNFKGINYPTPCPFEKIWINWIEIVNSNLTVNAFENFKGPQLKGLYDIKLEHSKWTGGNDPYQEPNRVTNQWPTLDTQPKDIKAWPCTPVPFIWDSNGIRPKVDPTRKCPGIRTSLVQQPLTASLDPSMFQYPRNITQYRWMFDNTRIIPALQYMGA